MDRFTRNAVIGTGLVLALLILSLVPWDRMSLRPRIWQLNDILSQDPILAAYPYEIRALLFLNGVVTLTRPYDDQVPVNAFLGAIDPALAGKAADDPALVAAKDRLRQHEMHAIMLMVAEPDVDSVVWQLDRARLFDLGIALPSAAAAGR
jgi:hypothetical protein